MAIGFTPLGLRISLTSSAALALMSVAGCCGVVSQRFHDSPDGAWPPDAGVTESCVESGANAGDMSGSFLSLKYQFHAALQPEPTAFEPPRSRFHPVPTQPVFNPRPEYAPPEPLAVVMPASVNAQLSESPTVELLPTPAAKPVAPQAFTPADSTPVDQASALSAERNPLR